MYRNKFLLVILILSGVSLLWLFSEFLKPALVAMLLVLATKNISEYIENWLTCSSYKIIRRHSRVISAAILTLILALSVLIPLSYLIFYPISSFDYSMLLSFKANVTKSFNSISWISPNIKAKVLAMTHKAITDITGGGFQQVLTWTSGYIKQITTGLLNLVLVVIFFFLFHRFKVEIAEFFIPLFPVSDKQRSLVIKNVIGTLTVVFMTIFAVAIAQGIAFAILMIFFDYNPFLLGVFTAIASVIPVFGTALVWVPVALNELFEGHMLNAIVIGVYSWLVLAFLIDNFVRIYILNKTSKMLQLHYF